MGKVPGKALKNAYCQHCLLLARRELVGVGWAGEMMAAWVWSSALSFHLGSSGNPVRIRCQLKSSETGLGPRLRRLLALRLRPSRACAARAKPGARCQISLFGFRCWREVWSWDTTHAPTEATPKTVVQLFRPGWVQALHPEPGSRCLSVAWAGLRAVSFSPQNCATAWPSGTSLRGPAQPEVHSLA
jgi:hypothetical protein